MWDETAMWSQRLERFLKHGDRATQLQAMEARGSPFEFLDGAVKAALAEDLRLDNKAGWNYLKALPLSRRKRKQWIVNLFAGPFPTTPGFKVLEDGCVLVEVDITRSKAFDLRKQSGDFRALMWAAATGKIGGIMASPPLRGRQDEELVAKAMWCSTVAKAANNYYGLATPFVLFEGAKLMNYVYPQEENLENNKLSRPWKEFW